MFEHKTVLQNEAIDALDIKPNGVYVDCTLGGGGHAIAILQRLAPQGVLIGFDQDKVAVEHVVRKFGNDKRLIVVHSNFSQLEAELSTLGFDTVDGVLFDLGVSSPQLDNPERGFSYHGEDELDMRMDRRQPTSARDIVNEYSMRELTDIIQEYGEERWAKRIAQFIVDERKQQPIETTADLVSVIKKAIPVGARGEGHPARRTFQAIRIAVNQELDVLESALRQAIRVVAPKGSVCVISFHSLEDRIVKTVFKEYAKGCTCPPGLPICVCGKVPLVRTPGRQPIYPTQDEVKRNPRARSAKMRVAVKLKGSKE